jgi:Fe-S cluster assembly ATP-binding protein
MLQIKNIKVTVEGKEILKGVSLEVRVGEVEVIMGQNGSGKSTLAYTLMGKPNYEMVEGEIWLDGERVDDKTPDERAKRGLFLVNQQPVAVPGLTCQSFLWQIYKNSRKSQVESPKSRPEADQPLVEKVEKMANIVEFRKWLEQQAETIGLNPELLKRGLNDGFSGGEKKKMELLQLLVANPKYIILDEIDSGLDVDALKTILTTINKLAQEGKVGVILITHYARVLKYLKVDRVNLMVGGDMVKKGGVELIEMVEQNGYGLEQKENVTVGAN